MERTVLTAIGDDRPGIVEEVSQFVFERGGSIEESRMANLMGQFAIAMLVAGGVPSIERDLAEFAAASGIDARLSHVGPARERGGRTYRLQAQALDQPGLVHEIADVFRAHGANVEALDSTIHPAPVSGSPVFAMTVDVRFDGEVEALRRDLERVCETLGFDSTFEPHEP